MRNGIRFKTRKFIEQLERTPELQIRPANEEMPEEP